MLLRHMFLPSPDEKMGWACIWISHFFFFFWWKALWASLKTERWGWNSWVLQDKHKHTSVFVHSGWNIKHLSLAVCQDWVSLMSWSWRTVITTMINSSSGIHRGCQRQRRSHTSSAAAAPVGVRSHVHVDASASASATLPTRSCFSTQIHSCH